MAAQKKMQPTSTEPLASGFVTAGRRRRARRYWTVTAVLAALATLLWWAQLLLGDAQVSVADVFAVIAGQNVPGASFVIGELRLPRAVVGLVAGLAFGLAGRTSQALLRNELASPDIIGITSGASTAAIIGILVLGWSGFRLSLMAVICGLLTAALIFALSGSGRFAGGRLILIGIGISAMFGSLSSFVQIRANAYDIPTAMRWLSGSLAGARWDATLSMLLGALVVGAAVLVWLAPSLGVLALGEESATGLGVHPQRTRALLIAATVVLAACATAVTGPIAFVSFLAGPIVARLVGATERSLLLPAALMGALIVLGADLAGQYLFPNALPVGVVTGLVGAPYLLLQLVRLSRQGASS